MSYVPNQPYRYPGGNPSGYSQRPKSWVVAVLLGVLGLLVVGLPLSSFYLGYNKRAITQIVLLAIGWLTMILLIGFVIFGAVYLWVLVDFVLLLGGWGGFDRDADGVPLER